MTPDLSFLDLGIVSLLILASIGLSVYERLGLERDIVVSCLRAFIQLTLVGYVLAALFQNVEFYWVALSLAIMIAAAVRAGRSRVEGNVPRLGSDLTVAITVVSLITLAFVIGTVVRPGLWFDPQVVIPLAGMTVGNTMTSSTLAANRFVAELQQRQNDVEALLALGATSEQAVSGVVRDSVRSALIPTIAGMMVVGLVSLPGMMTGQILAGQDPTQAVRYQIVVQYMLMFAAFAASTLIVRLIRRRYFTSDHQLRWNLLRSMSEEPRGTSALDNLLSRLRTRS